MLQEGNSVLQERYRLTSLIRRNGDHEVWRATDQEIDDVLVKAWSYPAAVQGGKPSEVDRALWDVELRHLFRLTSAPEADSRLVVLRNAGIDLSSGHFILVLGSPGLSTLEELLANRALCGWLTEIRKPDVRCEVWKSIRQLALGLVQIHDQQMIHGRVSASTVYVRPQQGGPRSMRLGGYEWSIRVASPAGALLDPATDLMPPEWSADLPAYSFESDWFSFGVLLARVLAPAAPEDRSSYHTVLDSVRKSELFEPERWFIERLLDENPATRLAPGTEVLKHIDAIVRLLTQPQGTDENAYLALAVRIGRGTDLQREICEEYPNIGAFDVEAQRAIIEDDLKEARIILLPGGGLVLDGIRLQYWIEEFAPRNEAASGRWDIGFSQSRAQVRYGEESIHNRVMDIPIKVFPLHDANNRRDTVTRHSVSWKRYLPQKGESGSRLARLDRFHEFLRVTNQVEVLFCDSEIFAYERLTFTRGPTHDEILIRAKDRDRPPLEWARKSRAERNDMLAFLERGLDEQLNGELLYLGSEESIDLKISPDDLTMYWTRV